jgi:RNA polymerase sigma factor (sigma-70 family)
VQVLWRTPILLRARGKCNLKSAVGQQIERTLQDRLSIVPDMSLQTDTPAAVSDRVTTRTTTSTRSLRKTSDPRTKPPAAVSHDSAAARRVAKLVERAARGEAEAWDDLVDQFSPLVWSIARAHRLSDADADDMFQTTWLVLLEHIDRLKRPGRLAGWLTTTARREALRLARHNVRLLPIDEERLASSPCDDDAITVVLTCERDSAVRHAFTTLAARDQTLLTLLVAEPRRSYEQIARTLGMPIGSIGPTRSRCLERLRRAMVGTGLDAAH